jgi:hypothetical protein
MTLASQDAGALRRSLAAPTTLSPRLARGLLAAAVALGAVGGAVAVDPHVAASAAHAAGPDLARLLRAMAALKVLMAAPLVAAVGWRLGTMISAGPLLAYAAACAAMAAGPGLIWSLAEVKLGALLLHGGLLGTAVLLWRDPTVRERLSAAVAARRTVLARRSAEQAPR